MKFSLTFYVIFILYKFYFTSQNQKDKEVETLNYYNLFSPKKKFQFEIFEFFENISIIDHY